jgi:hypothetical protein
MTSADLAKKLGYRFIERRDVKAVQRPHGGYEPDRSPWKLQDLIDHIEGTRTLGHYMLSPDSRCRLFAYDIDLVKGIKNEDGTEWLPIQWEGSDPFFPREAFLTDSPQRPTLIAQLNALAEGLARRVHKLGIPVEVAYSGSKGVHVYGFTGSIDAGEARAVALAVLESFGVFEPARGQHFWKHADGYEAIEIEVFPKQDSLDGKDLGNLMRLPLGIHQKTKQPGYFLSTVPPLDEFTAMESEAALDGQSPWGENG